MEARDRAAYLSRRLLSLRLLSRRIISHHILIAPHFGVQERMGPGGLDPVEVFATLPEEMQIAFENKDTPMLKKSLLGMSEKDRK